MKISTRQVELMTISCLPGLDPVRVILDDYGPGMGRLTVGCFGDAWEHYWGAMGDHHTLRTFLLKAHEDYIVTKLLPGPDRELDFEAISKAVGQDFSVNNYYELGCLDHQLLVCAYGEDWQHNLPEKHTRDYQYLTKIINSVKAALSSEAGS